MKIVYSFLFFVISCSFMSAQNINQFDENGKRHGIWKKYFDDTQILRYEGTFNHGKEIGFFKFYKKINDKAVLTATKQFNATNNLAIVKFLTAKGKVISEGQMLGKIYTGTWKYYQKRSNELLILENYNNLGQLNGERSVYYKNGQIAEKQNYKNGKLHGTSFWYSENNVVIKEFIYEEGELHGLSKFYNPLGVLITEGVYKNGKKHGIWKYYENEKLVKEKDFSYKPKYSSKE